MVRAMETNVCCIQNVQISAIATTALPHAINLVFPLEHVELIYMKNATVNSSFWNSIYYWNRGLNQSNAA